MFGKYPQLIQMNFPELYEKMKNEVLYKEIKTIEEALWCIDQSIKCPQIFESREQHEEHRIRMIKELIKVDKNGALHLIAMSGFLKNCIEKAKEVLNQGADINNVYNISTPLHSAISSGYPKMVKFLLENKANKNFKSGEHKNALYFAAAVLVARRDNMNKIPVIKNPIEIKSLVEFCQKKAKDEIVRDHQEIFLLLKN